jgi:hypothetical protein
MAIVRDLARPYEPVDQSYSSINRKVPSSPIGAVTPQYRGEIVVSVADGYTFIALGTTSNDWVAVSLVN